MPSGRRGPEHPLDGAIELFVRRQGDAKEARQYVLSFGGAAERPAFGLATGRMDPELAVPERDATALVAAGGDEVVAEVGVGLHQVVDPHVVVDRLRGRLEAIDRPPLI